MAESFLFAIATKLLEELSRLFIEARNVPSEFRKLEKTMSHIQAVLLDAERQQHHNEKLRLCMWKLRDIFYDAEDVIDDFKCKAIRKQVWHDPNISRKMRTLTLLSRDLLSFNSSPELKDINHRLADLATEWSSFNLVQCSEHRHVFHIETHSFVNSCDVIGRGVDKENIIGLLEKPSEDPVIPIVGIGGLGKTTLAQLVYNDARVSVLFPLKIWICVSVEFDLSRLLKLMVHSINHEVKCDNSTVQHLQTLLRNLLDDKKFLLVLDDVWSEDQARWIELRDLLPSMDGLFGSKIIVTTRIWNVATIMSSSYPYELKGLNHDECLSLFAKWAFNHGGERHHPNLMRIGEEIVKKCKGVPLAVRTLGSLLFSKTGESDWISIRDSETWTLNQRANDISPVLKLSYTHLPSHLQRCFAFLSLYKKDEIYHSHEVIQLWMANGSLEHPRQNQEWEDVGERYLDELRSRCLIQKEKDYGYYFTFTMHDLIHDLALDVSQKENKTVNCQTQTIDEDVRHLSFCDKKLLKVPQALKKLKKVRTVFIQEVSEESKTIHESIINLCVSNYRYLRALRLCPNSQVKALPNFIHTLKHLRDLDLTGCQSIRKLPFLFYKLQSLQKLKMAGVPLMQLPDDMESLTELRYLEITIKARHLKEIQQGWWTSLQHLGLIDCENLECLPEGLGHLASLRRLDLLSCSNLVSLPQSLKFLSKLEDLRISSCKKINLLMEREKDDEHLRLSLKSFSIWDSDMLEDLPQLLLEGSSATLRKIRIEYCKNFKVLPEWLENITSLHKIRIRDCPEFLGMPDGMEHLMDFDN